MPSSVQSYGLQPARLPCPWDSPGNNTGVGGHALLQGNRPNPGIEPASLTSNLHSLPLALLGKPLLCLDSSNLGPSGERLLTLPLRSTSLPLNPGDHHLHSAPDKLSKLQRQFFRANCLERRVSDGYL